MADKWAVVCEPEGKNPGPIAKAASEKGVPGTQGNVGGMVIYLTDGTTRQETSRVAWVRRNSRNPKSSFEKQFKTELDKAREACKVLNEMMGNGDLV